jgi:hypothetical protein
MQILASVSDRHEDFSRPILPCLSAFNFDLLIQNLYKNEFRLHIDSKNTVRTGYVLNSYPLQHVCMIQQL